MSHFEFRNHAVRFNAKDRKINCSFFGADGKIAASITELEFCVITHSGNKTPLSEYTKCEEHQLPSVKFPAMPNLGHWDFSLIFSDSRKKLPDMTLMLQLFADRIDFSVSGATLCCHGVIRNGEDAEHELFAISDTGTDDILYCASGPAANPNATMLYNRKNDSALKCDGNTMSLLFDWEKDEYVCDFIIPEGKTISFRRTEKICQTLFHLSSWAPLAKKHQFPTPPVGWMTWYSLRFDTCETTVLENARRMHDLFKNFTEKICIWVDWEWCHADLKGNGSDGVDVFHPRKDAYPHGLKYVSDAIRKLGELPALWCGVTVEGRVNKFMKKHPETLLTDFTLWPGHLWFDLTNPLIAKEYIPQVFKQFLKWGYEVFKWDCWLNSVRVNDEFHDRCFDRNKSMEVCQHELVEAARKVIGSNRYLLGCTIDPRPSLAGSDLYDGFRVGGDVFSWQDFRGNGVNNTFYYYPLHNTRLYLDPDTLVLRKEYSDDEQARTRVAFLALTGLQLTVGDPLKALDDLRIDALKRAMPVAEVRPVELTTKMPTQKLLHTFTAMERPFGRWYISGSFNFDKRKRKNKIRYRELGMLSGKYAAFEFWSQSFLGISETGYEMSLKPGGSSVVRVTPVSDIPVLIGSSRHLLQGAVELMNLKWDANKAKLEGKTLVAGNEPVNLTFYVPNSWIVIKRSDLFISENLVRLKLYTQKNAELSWEIYFNKNHI